MPKSKTQNSLRNQANPPATTTPQPTVQPSLQSQQNPQPSRPSTRISSQTTNSSTISTNTTQSVTSSAGNNRGSYQSASRTSSSLNNTQNQSSLISFFESLTWSGVDPSLPQNQGLLAIADEIKRISTGQRPIYRQIPVAATTLLRSLLEQTLKYHLRKKDPQALSGMSQRYDPSLNSLLKHYTDNQKYTQLITDQSMQRVFSSLFTTSGLKDFLDLSVHQPHYVRPSDQLLEVHSRAGLFSFINHILNLP